MNGFKYSFAVFSLLLNHHCHRSFYSESFINSLNLSLKYSLLFFLLLRMFCVRYFANGIIHVCFILVNDQNTLKTKPVLLLFNWELLQFSFACVCMCVLVRARMRIFQNIICIQEIFHAVVCLMILLPQYFAILRSRDFNMSR